MRDRFHVLAAMILALALSVACGGIEVAGSDAHPSQDDRGDTLQVPDGAGGTVDVWSAADTSVTPAVDVRPPDVADTAKPPADTVLPPADTVLPPADTFEDGSDAVDAGEAAEDADAAPDVPAFWCVGAADCDDADPCTDDRCETSGVCSHVWNTAPCDDSDPCTIGDACDGAGHCSGTAYSCLPDPCDVSSSCDGAGGCVVRWATPGTACDDGDACTADDACDIFGACVGRAAVTCDDGDACNGVETCEPPLGCRAGTALDCDDGRACSVDACDPDLGCTHDLSFCQCSIDEDCDDHDACTGVETCDPNAGTCLSGVPVTCDDGDACNGRETCEPTTGACLSGTPLDCVATAPCTQARCDAIVGCVTEPTTGGPCSDGDACTMDDRCVDGACVGGPALGCDDGNACNGQESCDPAAGCVPGTPLSCSTTDVCTDVRCDPGAGCVYTPNTGRACDDRLGCTASDTCVDGDCDGTNTCPAKNPECTTDGCICGYSVSTGSRPVICDARSSRCVAPCILGLCNSECKCGNSAACAQGQECRCGLIGGQLVCTCHTL